jgi:glutathione S-transferase
VRNSNPLFAGRVVPGHRSDLAQLPEITERGKAVLMVLLPRLDSQLKDHAFIAGARFSIADITGYFMMLAAAQLEVAYAETCPNVARWYAEVAERPSTDA